MEHYSTNMISNLGLVMESASRLKTKYRGHSDFVVLAKLGNMRDILRNTENLLRFS